MRSQRTLRAAAVGALVLLFASGCSAGGSASPTGGSDGGGLEDMEPITLTYASHQSGASASVGPPFEAFAERVFDESDGKITIEPYFDSTLLPGPEILAGVGDGVADIGDIFAGYYPEALPVSNWLLAMGSLATGPVPEALVGGSAALNEFSATEPSFSDQWTERNVKPLWVGMSSADYSLLCVNPIESAADAEGLRVRVGSPVWQAELEALGMVPVTLPLSEVYEGLQRGVIDCVNSSAISMVNAGYWDVAKHFYPLSMSATNGLANVINLDVWNSLPPAAQTILTEASAQWWLDYQLAIMDVLDRFGTEGPSEHGIIAHDPRPLDKVILAHQKQVIENIVDTAPPGVEDPQAFVDNYIAALEKWNARAAEALGIERDPSEDRDGDAVMAEYATSQDVDYTEWKQVIQDELFSKSSG